MGMGSIFMNTVGIIRCFIETRVGMMLRIRRICMGVVISM